MLLFMGMYAALGLVFIKIVATSLTLGSGGSGGIFAPSLLGRYAWCILRLFRSYFPDITAAIPGAYALVAKWVDWLQDNSCSSHNYCI